MTDAGVRRYIGAMKNEATKSKYVVMAGTFHDRYPSHDLIRSEHRTLAAAEREVAKHSRECSCGGVHVRVRPGADLAVDLDRETGERTVLVVDRTNVGTRGMRLPIIG